MTNLELYILLNPHFGGGGAEKGNLQQTKTKKAYHLQIHNKIKSNKLLFISAIKNN